MVAVADIVVSEPVARTSWINQWSQRYPMLRFVIARSATAVLTVLGASMLAFFAVQALPGNVVTAVLGRNATPELTASVSAQLGLDQPLIVRYLTWLGHVVTGDFGYSTASVVTGSPVSTWSQISEPLAHSLTLAGVTMLLFGPLSLAIGAFSALRAGHVTDHTLSTASLVFAAMPEFLIGTVLIYIFYWQLKVLPPVASLAGSSGSGIARQFVMPVLTLLLVNLALTVRLVRSSTIQILQEDYVAMANLNGYRSSRIIWRYALRNALAPGLQALGLTAGYLIGGVVVVEAVFGYPGIGQQLVQAVNQRDVQNLAILATLLASATVTINLIVDIATMLLVPRLRTAAR